MPNIFCYFQSILEKNPAVKRSLDCLDTETKLPAAKRKKVNSANSGNEKESEAIMQICDFFELRDKIQSNIGLTQQRSILRLNKQYIPKNEADVSFRNSTKKTHIQYD